MQFRAEFFPKVSDTKINHKHKLFLIGSCFTEQVGEKLAAHKFEMLQNPHGILFNPASIAKALQHYATSYTLSENDLFYHDELYGSWDHHTKFSDINATIALNKMNSAIQEAAVFLKQTDWVIITLGSAFVYALRSPEDRIVANCHKIPADKFEKRLLSVEDTRNYLNQMVQSIRQMNPDTRIIFTISPVRHLRDGFIENNRSKAVLIQAVHDMVNNDNIHYFPSYELIIDDLRDYRFFAEDLAHPNYAATQYVYEKFTQVYMDDSTRLLMKEVQSIMYAYKHNAFNPTSQQHQQFLQRFLDKSLQLQKDHPYLNLEKEIHYFSSQLTAF